MFVGFWEWDCLVSLLGEPPPNFHKDNVIFMDSITMTDVELASKVTNSAHKLRIFDTYIYFIVHIPSCYEACAPKQFTLSSARISSVL